MTKDGNDVGQNVIYPDDTVAVVIFHHHTDIKWLSILKVGFRHCMVMLRLHGYWVIYDPLSHCTSISLGEGLTILDVCRYLRRSGGHILVVRPEVVPLRQPLPWRPYTCVEAVKRVLGLRAPQVFTPWQLYQYLKARRRSRGSRPHAVKQKIV